MSFADTGFPVVGLPMRTSVSSYPWSLAECLSSKEGPLSCYPPDAVRGRQKSLKSQFTSQPPHSGPLLTANAHVGFPRDPNPLLSTITEVTTRDSTAHTYSTRPSRKRTLCGSMLHRCCPRKMLAFLTSSFPRHHLELSKYF